MPGRKRLSGICAAVGAAALVAGAPGCGAGGGGSTPEALLAWTENPALVRDDGSWELRSFCWTIFGDCPDDLHRTEAEWVADGEVRLSVSDDTTGDLGADVAAMTQGVDFGGNVRGAPLDLVAVGDLEAAYILLRRSGAEATGCQGVFSSGNIVNLWLENLESRARWVTDFYFETVGLNSAFGERPGPHNALVVERRKLGIDWYAYQIELRQFPQYWSLTTDEGGVEDWTIDLKGLLDRGAEFSGRNLSEYHMRYVEVVSENVCFGRIGESVARQKVHYFEIKTKLRAG